MRNVCIILCSLCFSQSEQIFYIPYIYKRVKNIKLLSAEKIFFAELQNEIPVIYIIFSRIIASEKEDGNLIIFL